MKIISLDTETHLIGQPHVNPQIVCYTFAYFDDDKLLNFLVASGDPQFADTIAGILNPDTDNIIVGHNIAYDLSCISRTFPHLIPNIFKLLRQGRITCTLIREKLLNLSTVGHVAYIPVQDATIRVKYSLTDLEEKYFGASRKEEKKDPNSWRLRYKELDGKPVTEYPREAIEYAVVDAISTLSVYYAQENAAKALQGELAPQGLRTAFDYVLRMTTVQGLATDQEKRLEIETQLQAKVSAEMKAALIESGILQPAVPCLIYKRQEDVNDVWWDQSMLQWDGKALAQPKPNHVVEAWFQDYYSKGIHDPNDPVIQLAKQARYVNASDNKKRALTKFKDPEPESINQGLVREIVQWYFQKTGREAPMSASGEKVSISDDTLAELEHDVPIIKTLRERQSVEKLLSTYLPKMAAPRIHFPYDSLKETGRSSSSEDDAFPSMNGQNLHPDIREIFVPDPGYVLFSADFTAMELVTLADTCYNLFGFSVLRDMLLAGIDPHAYLGAQLCYADHLVFQTACDQQRCDSPQKVYEVFIQLKDSANPELQKIYKEYRTIAKPVGLGFPGGLGCAKFVHFARGYGLNITEEKAQFFKDIWFRTYPEVTKYFEWVNSDAIDYGYPDAYWYRTSLGMLRRNCSFCSVANGKGLQSPGAEGALLALFFVQDACLNRASGSILYGGLQVADFVHDELVGQVIEDDMMQQRCSELVRLMEDAFSLVCRSIPIKASITLMRRWRSKLPPLKDSQGLLLVTP